MAASRSEDQQSSIKTPQKESAPEIINGEALIIRSLKQQGVKYMFGVVGFPVFGIAIRRIRKGRIRIKKKDKALLFLGRSI